jgi:hypothetical protein
VQIHVFIHVFVCCVTAKTGVCPTAYTGSVEFGCLRDSQCPGNQKCCRLGVSRQCLTPLTGQWPTTSDSPLSPVTSARPLHHSSAPPPDDNLSPAKSLDGTSSAVSWIFGTDFFSLRFVCLSFFAGFVVCVLWTWRNTDTDSYVVCVCVLSILFLLCWI